MLKRQTDKALNFLVLEDCESDIDAFVRVEGFGRLRNVLFEVKLSLCKLNHFLDPCVSRATESLCLIERWELFRVTCLYREADLALRIISWQRPLVDYSMRHAPRNVVHQVRYVLWVGYVRGPYRFVEVSFLKVGEKVPSLFGFLFHFFLHWRLELKVVSIVFSEFRFNLLLTLLLALFFNHD